MSVGLFFSLLYGLSPVTGPQVGKHCSSATKLHILNRNGNDDKLTEETMDEKGR